MITPLLSVVGARPWTTEHQPPPNVDSVPHSTSAWARKGLIHASGYGVRIPSGPGRRFPVASNEPIACQKTSRKTVPIVIARTPKIVIAVDAVVRLTRLEQSRPNEPRPRAVTISTM